LVGSDLLFGAARARLPTTRGRHEFDCHLVLADLADVPSLGLPI
jgi:hypothetical protein